MGKTTWHKLLEEAGVDFSKHWESTLSEEEMHREFDSDYGCTEGPRFTFWTKDRVYFPICYDGAEWVGSAPRNPCDEALGHQGGG